MSAANLLKIIRQEIIKAIRAEAKGFELATVISPYPEPVIKIDNMKIELGKRDLIVCERLGENMDRGDRVLVQAIPGGQKYIIVDRVVEHV